MSACEHTVAACIGFAVSVALVGCISGVESIAADVSPEGWNEPVELRHLNTDTLTIKQLHLTLRHSATIPASDGRYVVEALSPSGTGRRDTLTVTLSPDTQRKKLGEAAATPVNLRLSEAGQWRFVVTPMQNTTGVWSVGIELKQ